MLSACASVTKTAAIKNEDGDLVGFVSKKNFQEEPYGSEWFNDFYSYYEVDSKTVASIKENTNGVTVKGFMGT